MWTRVERKAGWLLALIVVGIIASVSWSLFQKWQNSTTLRVGNRAFSVEVADTEPARVKGLGGREKLSASEGLLLVFPSNGKWGVWMKDMKFPLDIIWLDEKHRVVHITKNVYPNTYPETFYPDKAARYILEVNAGTVEAEQILINQTAHFDLPSR